MRRVGRASVQKCKFGAQLVPPCPRVSLTWLSVPALHLQDAHLHCFMSAALPGQVVLYLFTDPPLTPFLNGLFTRLDGAFPLFGTAAFALFCFYLIGPPGRRHSLPQHEPPLSRTVPDGCGCLVTRVCSTRPHHTHMPAAPTHALHVCRMRRPARGGPLTRAHRRAGARARRQARPSRAARASGCACWSSRCTRCGRARR